MLLINQCLDKLAAARVDFESRGMLDENMPPPPSSTPTPLALNEDDDEVLDAPGMTALGDVKLATCPGERL
jgi:hypothetical protein